jgi:hypothetical protein
MKHTHFGFSGIGAFGSFVRCYGTYTHTYIRDTRKERSHIFILLFVYSKSR